MSLSLHEEILVGKTYYYVAYLDCPDPNAFAVKCPKCKRKQSAYRLNVTVHEVQTADTRETVHLDDAFKKRVERAVRRHLLQKGLMVTPTFSCEVCNSVDK